MPDEKNAPAAAQEETAAAGRKMTKKKGGITVQSHKGRNRSGFRFDKTRRFVPYSLLTEEELNDIKNDPNLLWAESSDEPKDSTVVKVKSQTIRIPEDGSNEVATAKQLEAAQNGEFIPHPSSTAGVAASPTEGVPATRVYEPEPTIKGVGKGDKER